MGVLFPGERSGVCSIEDAVAGAIWREREDVVSQHGNWGLKDLVGWCLLPLRMWILAELW